MSEQELEGQGQVEAPEQEVATEGEQQEAPEGKESGKEAPQLSEVEQLAREMGWSPQSEWRGPKESWKPASDYIRHGTTIQRELKNRNDALAREYEQRFQRLDRASQAALTRQREQLSAQYEAEKRQAVTIGDVNAYEAANRAQTEALKRFDAEAAEIAPRDTAPGKAPLAQEIIDFGQRNRWFDVDPVMTHAAVGLAQDLASKYPNMPLGDRLDRVEWEMKRRFPSEFGGNGSQSPSGNGGGVRTPQVEGGLRPIKTSKGKDWESMPGEAKTAGEKYIKQGLFKDKTEYAKSYWEQ